MVRLDVRVLRTLALSTAAILTLAACGPGTSPGESGAESPGAGASADAGGQRGGTIYILSGNEEFAYVDPQRSYTGEDLAFFGATIYRSLVAYTVSPDDVAAAALVPDLATDTGTPNEDGSSWQFTLRDGVTFEDGSPITCEDVKYGVSRTFANDIINGGPTYAVQYLDIPANPITDEADPKSVFLSAYYGPYDGTGQDLFDAAVVCDGATITFNLGGPHPDFNYTTTLGFSPVPKAADTGETYGVAKPPVSSGPYKIDSYVTGVGGKMILSRNENWSQASDEYRTPYPDNWEVHFGLDEKAIDQRLITSAANDVTAIEREGIQPENLQVVFLDPETPQAQFEGRAVSGYDIYALYYHIDVNKVPNVKHRQAMAVALDRAAIRKNSGGDFLGEFADGVIKPNIGPDYAPSGMWTDMFGEEVPDSGNPELAKQLIADSGEPVPTLFYNFADTPTGQKNAAIVISSLGLAGITVTPAPLERGAYYTIIPDPAKAGHFGGNGWGADWPNASTVIPPLFTLKGGWDVSQVDDAAFNTKVDEALAELDRTKQSVLWQALNKEAMEQVYAIPTFFELSQRLAGTKINPDAVYLWGPYGSWPYGALSVVP